MLCNHVRCDAILLIIGARIYDSDFGYIFTTDCTDYMDFSSQEATMAGCRTIRMAGAAEAQNPYNPCNPLWKNTSET